MSESPVFWLLLGAKAGDNAQVTELAARLPVKAVAKQLTFNFLHQLPNFMLRASTASLSNETRKLFQPPWPDGVIAAGKRSVPAARWIKQQSGGRTKLIHIGRPRAPLAAFDLVVTTPQYGLPRDANVLELGLPLTAKRTVAPDQIAKWRDEWALLPRPLFCVAIGAAKFPIRLGLEEAETIAQKLNSVVAATGGSVVVLASPRSEAKVMQALARQIKVPNRVYATFQRVDNPYVAALQICDRFVVTSDSASMIADGIRAGKPVEVIRLPVSSARVAWSARRGLGAFLSRTGLMQPPRTMARVVDNLLTAGVVGELGGRPAALSCQAEDSELIDRVMQLVNARL